MAEIEAGNPLTKAASVVEYSSIVIGGQSYICPSRSISLSQAASLPPSKGIHSMGYTLGPQKTFLNRTVFANYRRFGSESRIITDADATPNTNPVAESPTGNSRVVGYFQSSPLPTPEPRRTGRRIPEGLILRYRTR